MTKIDYEKRIYTASIKANDKVLAMYTSSGSGLRIADYKEKEYICKPDVDNQTIGLSLLDALAHSRYVLPVRTTDAKRNPDPPDVEFDLDLYDNKHGAEHYKAWVARLLAFTGCKTKTRLFKPMYSVSVVQQGNITLLSPSFQERLDGWGGMGKDVDLSITIASNSSPEEIGAAVRLAISRCKSVYTEE